MFRFILYNKLCYYITYYIVIIYIYILYIDLYTFDEDEREARETYDTVTETYEKIFKDLHLDVIKGKCYQLRY